MYTIEQIEDAIIAKLDPLKSTLGVRTIKSYQGELQDEAEIKKVVRLFPAIFVVYGGSVYEQHGARKMETMSYILFSCDRSLRVEEEARRGGANNPGTYAMLDSTRDKLCAQTLALDIDPIKILRQEAVWFGKGVSVYSSEYETTQAHLYTGQ